jgi:hypothetical protein
VRPGHGVCAGERLVACVVVWLVGAWRRRQAPIRLAESPRIPSSKSVWNSRSCTISRSPSKIGETERCYLFFRQLNYPQAEGTRPVNSMAKIHARANKTCRLPLLIMFFLSAFFHDYRSTFSSTLVPRTPRMVVGVRTFMASGERLAICPEIMARVPCCILVEDAPS